MPASSVSSHTTAPSPQKDSTSSSRSTKAYNVTGKPFQLFSVLPYYFIFVLYAVGFISVKYYHNPYWIVLFLYVGLPLMDYSISDDWLNPDKDQTKILLDNFWFKIPVYGQVILDTLFLPWMVYYLTTGEFSWTFYLGAITLCGLLSSLHFGNAHELFHKKSAFDKVVGSLTVAKNYYIHYYLDHTYGHHKHVATYDDPTTSRYGESLYQYLPRCVIGAYKSAWEIEKNRLIKRNGFKTHWVPQNRMIWITLTYLVLPVAVYQLLGLKGVLIHFAIVAMSITSFETVEYLEHYGLIRKKIGPNEYEPVNVTHSWNAPQRISNYILFKVQRHSDHHHNAYKPYQVLSSYDESPCLPHGYTLCQIVAFVPPVFFKMMDILLKAIKENRDLTAEETKTINRNSYSLVVVFGSLFTGLWILNQSYLSN